MATYPPAFDPTRQVPTDLGLSDYDVFIEGDSTNPMFFYVNGINRVFTYGKHYFTITFKENLNKDMQMYSLKEDTEILFEVRDANNTLILSQLTDLDYDNGIAVGYIDIQKDPGHTYEPIVDGSGTFIVVAELDGVPTKWKNTYNYRCIFPFEITKNSIYGNSPNILAEINPFQTYNGYFNFGKAAFTTGKGTGRHGGGYKYFEDGRGGRPVLKIAKH